MIMNRIYFESSHLLSEIEEKTSLTLFKEHGEYYVGNKSTPIFLIELTPDKYHIYAIIPFLYELHDEEESVFEELILNLQVKFWDDGYIDEMFHVPKKVMKKSMRDFGFHLKKHKVKKLNKFQKFLNKVFN